SEPARHRAPAANGTATRRAGWPATRGPCGHRGGCRTRSRVRHAPSAARCARRAGRRARPSRRSSRSGRARRPRAPARTGRRRWHGLRTAGRDGPLRYSDPMTSSPQITPPGTGPRPAGYAPAFVAEVLDDALAHDCRVYSITGLQGTGKSTIAAQLVGLARERGLHAVALSIDDFYLDHDERARLGREVHPLLATRGPPGSHDVALACEVVDALREGRSTRLPRFDKIADSRLPRTDWPVVDGVDLVLFEGWFQKVPAQLPDELSEPVNELERDEDPQGTWRTYCNAS